MKRLSREAIIRMVGSGSGSSGAAGGGGGSFDPSVLSGLATEDWTDGNYLSKNFFNALFTVHTSIHIVVTDSGGEIIDDYIEEGTLTPNQLPGQVVETDPSTGETTTTTTSITSIENKFGLYTYQFLSALGLNDGGGGGGGGSSYLRDLLDVQITTPTEGDVLTYDATSQKWKNKSLPSYATQAWVQQQGYITSTALNGYATQLWVQSQDYITSSYLSSYATKSWVQQSYVTELIEGTGTYAKNIGVRINGVNTGYITVPYAVTANYSSDSGLLDGTPKSSPSNYRFFNCIPVITSDKVMEIGQYVDFHVAEDSADFRTRLQAQSANGTNNTVSLPTGSGTLALLSDTVEQANRLSGSETCTAWGRQFWANGVPATIDGNMINVGDITAKSGVDSRINGFTGLELNSLGTLSGSGGFIDFHYNGLSGDYTSRIIEDASGRLTMNGFFKVTGNSVIIGGIEITVDNNGLHINSAGLYADTYLSALGFSSGGSSGGGGGTGDGTVASYTMPYQGTSSAPYYWHKLGSYQMNSTAMYLVIDVFSGNGFNGYASQNSWARITIKKSYSTYGTSDAVGVTCEQFGPLISNGKILVRINATAYNRGDVWIKCPWSYPSGAYTVQGNFTLWEHNASTGSDTTSTPTHNQEAVGYYDNTSQMTGE